MRLASPRCCSCCRPSAISSTGWSAAALWKQDPEIGEKWSGWIGTIMALAAFGVAVILGLSLIGNEYEAHAVLMFQWISVPSAGFHIPWAIQVDTLSVTMMLVVTGVGSLIHIYAIGYMHGDPDFSRFFAYLNLFLFFMLILVSGSSYLMLFVGWEGVGLCSFLLIGFWFREWKNADAARKAFVANRVGDFGMILAMILTFWTFGTLEFDGVFGNAVEMFEAGHMVEFGLFEASLGGVLTAICALFLLGAAGKSAQIPLYVWLPDAMAGPTPVSALIHAATMVTSGIYLIVRSNVLFEIVRESGDAGPRHNLRQRPGGADRRDDGAGRRADRLHPIRCQKGAGLLNGQPARLYDRRRRHGRLRGRYVPPDHPRLLQGAALPRLRLRHPRHGAWSPPLGHGSHGGHDDADDASRGSILTRRICAPWAACGTRCR